MCNFIIRPIKCYATVDIETVGEGEDLKTGEVVTVKSVESNGRVVVVRENDKTAMIPMEVFVHTFSDKDPNKKESKKDSKEAK